ncbi:MAG: winged helix-turn-helix transcriptional regulator [Lachnospiraceae bacterium]
MNPEMPNTAPVPPSQLPEKETDRHENCFMRETCVKDDLCPMVLAYKLLSGKRKIMILWFLSSQSMRFTEIRRKMPDVTQKMLTKQLRSLEDDHLIIRTVYPTVPSKVVYEISEIGSRTIPVLKLMHEFGAFYIEEYREEVAAKKAEAEISMICVDPIE